MLMTNTQRQKWIDYEGFVEKFKPKKTTDDCYTPEPVYNAIRDWVCKEYGLDASKFVRPFYPGGDYENYDYHDDCVVVDNPPFSILAEIIKFYLDAGVKFFLFAQGKTLFGYGNFDVCLLCPNNEIIFENGARVSVGFITNLESSGVRSAATLHEVIENACMEYKKSFTKEVPKFIYPSEVLIFSHLETLSTYGVDFKAEKKDLCHIRALDMQRDHGKAIYGGGFLLSKDKVVEVLAGKELAIKRCAGKKILRESKKYAIEWQLSDREREIVNGLGKSEIKDACA